MLWIASGRSRGIPRHGIDVPSPTLLLQLAVSLDLQSIYVLALFDLFFKVLFGFLKVLIQHVLAGILGVIDYIIGFLNLLRKFP